MESHLSHVAGIGHRDIQVHKAVNEIVWFIDNNNGGSSNTGTLTHPFTTLAAFEAVNGGGGANQPAAGHCIFIHSGSGNYTGGVTLENNQRLVGQGSSATIPTVCGHTPVTHTLALQEGGVN